MKVDLFAYNDGSINHVAEKKGSSVVNAGLVLVFGAKDHLKDDALIAAIKSKFSSAKVVYASTAGEICGKEVNEDSVVITALEFEKTEIKTSVVNMKDFADSKAAGNALAGKLPVGNLSYVLIISDGSLVNGSDLISGIDEVYLGKVPLTGGLAGDGNNFSSTVVGLDEVPASGNIVAVGFYGSSLQVGHGSMGGWDVFGPEKVITRSEGNVLYEIDGTSALQLYKEYLGKYAEELPGSALLFPLSLSVSDENESVVRTILSIDNARQSMTFAGDVPVGGKVRFMKANFDNIIDAASGAAKNTFNSAMDKEPDYALLISCVGRKIILKQRVDEEVEAVAEVFGSGTLFSGFYSYGELSPFNREGKCQLHNQTMTITTFSES